MLSDDKDVIIFDDDDGITTNEAGNLHVVAYSSALMSYSTNTSGSTSIRKIMN